jgi:hypothetical protein
VGPRAGLDKEDRGKILSPLPGIEPRSPDRPASSRTLYCLSYVLQSKHEKCKGLLEFKTQRNTGSSIIKINTKYEKIVIPAQYYILGGTDTTDGLLEQYIQTLGSPVTYLLTHRQLTVLGDLNTRI